jgi:hypothetical protein
VTFIGVEPTDMVGHKRLLSFLTGGMLPIISLTFLGLLVRFEEEDWAVKESPIEPKPEQVVDAKDLMSEVSKIHPTEEDLNKLEEMLKKRKPVPPSFVNDTETPEVKLPDTPQDIFLGTRNDDPVEIDELPKFEWIPALGDAEVMEMMQDEYERKFDENSTDYDELSNKEPENQPEVHEDDIPPEVVDYKPKHVEEVKKKE